MSKNGNNEGSVYKDKQGHWRGQVRIPTADGKVKRKYFYGKTRKKVSDKVNEILRQINMIPKNPSDLTVLPKHKKVEMRYFLPEDQKRLQEVIKGDKLECRSCLTCTRECVRGSCWGFSGRTSILI